MPNYSDNDSGSGSGSEEEVVAEGRREDWSDGDAAPPPGGEDTNWSDNDEPSATGGAPNVDSNSAVRNLFFPPAGVLGFGGGGTGTDKIGELGRTLETLVKKGKDKKSDFFKRAGDAAKAIRSISKDISALQGKGQKEITKLEKDKKADKDFVESQKAKQVSLATRIADATTSLAEDAKWFDQITQQQLAQGKFSGWKSEMFEIPGKSKSTEASADRDLLLHVPAGSILKSTGSDGVSLESTSTREKDHFVIPAGTKYQVHNPLSGKVSVKMLFHPIPVGDK